MYRQVGKHADAIFEKLTNRYNRSYRIKFESVDVAKKLENVACDRDLVLSGFLSGYGKLSMTTLEQGAYQLRDIGIPHTIYQPIMLLKYMETNDSVAKFLLSNNPWLFRTQMIYNARNIVDDEHKKISPHSKLDNVAWNKYMGEVYRQIYQHCLKHSR